MYTNCIHHNSTFFTFLRNYNIFGDGMNKLYMGIDVGSSYTKGVIIDKYDNIMSSYYIETLGDPINASKKVILKMKEDIDLTKYKVISVGVCGFAKKLVGTFLNSQIVKNEVVAVSTSVLRMYPNVGSIIDIGSEDSKLICIHNGNIIDTVINTACSAGCGNFLLNLTKKMNISFSELSNICFKGVHNIDLTNRCMVYAMSDLINKLKEGYSKEDIMYATCKMVSKNYVNGVCKGKKIKEPIIFSGGVSKNMTIVKCLEKELDKKIIVNKNSHLFGCIGVAILARESKIEKEFDFNIELNTIKTEMTNCKKCDNECTIVTIYKNNNLIDTWGNKCNNFDAIKNM